MVSPPGCDADVAKAAQQPPEPSAKNTQSIASTPAPSSKRRVPDSSRSPSPAAKRREGRPAYRPEEDDFIRFCRDDLCQSWECSTKLFNQTWHWDGTTRPRKIPGLQSRYYRLLEESVRDRKKATCGRPELGILEKTNRRYWWMTGAFTEEERAEFEKWRASKAEHGSEPELRMDTSGSYSSEGREDEQEEEEEDETSPLQSDEEDHLMQESNSPMPPSNQQSETGDQDDDDFHPHLMVPIAVSSATTDEEDQHDLSNAVAIAKALKMRRQIPYGRIELSPESADLMSSLRAPCKAGSTRVARRIKSRKRHRKGSTDEQSQGSEGWGDRTQMTDEGIEFLMPSRESNS
ncbi:hypothetical protein BZA05DRAFT_468185 [Tricharina praecox]|uniref:uncharacterized protein n=1 Tax=Tricharina praecox TaxID=43433 RepID=UPI00221FD29A|nr:uncharacterized protein BZA05DRAFT_468185 [Tricharina praecox]KAI5853678.1 hypothetical protein BZA05DRAFT_468185 [Tricharina praecox]